MLLIHFTDKCNGIIVEKENHLGSTRLWTLNTNCDKYEMIFDFKKEMPNIANVQCTKCGRSWISPSSAEKDCYQFSLLAEKNLRIIFTTIVVAVSMLFLSCIFYNTMHQLKGIGVTTSFLIAFLILISKQFCEVTEVNVCIKKIKKDFMIAQTQETTGGNK